MVLIFCKSTNVLEQRGLETKRDEGKFTCFSVSEESQLTRIVSPGEAAADTKKKT